MSCFHIMDRIRQNQRWRVYVSSSSPGGGTASGAESAVSVCILSVLHIYRQAEVKVKKYIAAGNVEMQNTNNITNSKLDEIGPCSSRHVETPAGYKQRCCAICVFVSQTLDVNRWHGSKPAQRPYGRASLSARYLHQRIFRLIRVSISRVSKVY